MTSFLIFPSFKETSIGADVDTLWIMFKTKLKALTDTYIPSKFITPRRRKDKPWVNKEVRTIAKRKRRVYVKYRQNGNPDFLGRLKELTALIKSKVSYFKTIYHNSLGDRLKRNPKEFRKCVKTSKKDVTGILPISDSAQLVDNDNDKAPLFNSYFESVFSSPIVGALSPASTILEDSMLDIELSQDGILKLINGSNENKKSVLEFCHFSCTCYLIGLCPLAASPRNGKQPMLCRLTKAGKDYYDWGFWRKSNLGHIAPKVFSRGLKE